MKRNPLHPASVLERQKSAVARAFSSTDTSVDYAMRHLGAHIRFRRGRGGGRMSTKQVVQLCFGMCASGRSSISTLVSGLDEATLHDPSYGSRLERIVPHQSASREHRELVEKMNVRLRKDELEREMAVLGAEIVARILPGNRFVDAIATMLDALMTAGVREALREVLDRSGFAVSVIVDPRPGAVISLRSDDNAIAAASYVSQAAYTADPHTPKRTVELNLEFWLTLASGLASIDAGEWGAGMQEPIARSLQDSNEPVDSNEVV